MTDPVRPYAARYEQLRDSFQQYCRDGARAADRGTKEAREHKRKMNNAFKAWKMAQRGDLERALQYVLAN